MLLNFTPGVHKCLITILLNCKTCWPRVVVVVFLISQQLREAIEPSANSVFIEGLFAPCLETIQLDNGEFCTAPLQLQNPDSVLQETERGGQRWFYNQGQHITLCISRAFFLSCAYFGQVNSDGQKPSL